MPLCPKLLFPGPFFPREFYPRDKITGKSPQNASYSEFSAHHTTGWISRYRPRAGFQPGNGSRVRITMKTPWKKDPGPSSVSYARSALCTQSSFACAFSPSQRLADLFILVRPSSLIGVGQPVLDAQPLRELAARGLVAAPAPVVDYDGGRRAAASTDPELAGWSDDLQKLLWFARATWPRGARAT